MKAKTVVYNAIILLAILAFVIVINTSVSNAASCSVDSDCDDDNICTRDSCKNRTECPAGCTINNCTTCTVEYYCSNSKISGCDIDRYIQKGQVFYMGKEACEDTYRFEGFDDLYVNISGQIYPFDRNDAKKEGFKITISKRYNQTYYLRLNETTQYLYLDSVMPSCPIVNECDNPLDCNDSNACTIDNCYGIPRQCHHDLVLYCKNGDGCCPSKCSPLQDSDCRKCSTDADCDDKKSYTKDRCHPEFFNCTNTNITDCINNDNFCAKECDFSKDNDCPNPDIAVCGDGKCTGNESVDNCCSDCGCPSNYNCTNNRCTQTDQQKVTDAIEKDPVFSEKDSDLKENGYSISGRQIAKKGEEWNFVFTYSKGTSQKLVSGRVTNESTVIMAQDKTSLGFIVLIVFAILIVSTLLLMFYKRQPKAVVLHEPKEPGVAGQIFSDDEPYSPEESKPQPKEKNKEEEPEDEQER